MKRMIAMLLALLLCMGGALAEGAMPEKVNDAYQTTGDYLATLGTPGVG